MNEETTQTARWRKLAVGIIPATMGAAILALGVMMSVPADASAYACYSKKFTWEDGCTYIDGNECAGPCPDIQV